MTKQMHGSSMPCTILFYPSQILNVSIYFLNSSPGTICLENIFFFSPKQKALDAFPDNLASQTQEEWTASSCGPPLYLPHVCIIALSFYFTALSACTSSPLDCQVLEVRNQVLFLVLQQLSHSTFIN